MYIHLSPISMYVTNILAEYKSKKYIPLNELLCPLVLLVFWYHFQVGRSNQDILLQHKRASVVDFLFLFLKMSKISPLSLAKNENLYWEVEMVGYVREHERGHGKVERRTFFLSWRFLPGHHRLDRFICWKKQSGSLLLRLKHLYVSKPKQLLRLSPIEAYNILSPGNFSCHSTSLRRFKILLI